jgi:hypothetical protein
MLEMTFTESLLEKRALFSLLKSGGAHAPIAPPFHDPWRTQLNEKYITACRRL